MTDRQQDHLLAIAKELAWETLTPAQKKEFKKAAQEKWVKEREATITKTIEDFEKWQRKTKEDPDECWLLDGCMKHFGED
jgi:hypothetical protein